MRDWFSDNRIIIGFSILGAATIGLLVWAAIEESQACAKAGGHIASTTTLATGISGSGQVVMTPVTVSFCLSPDGRILNK